MNRRTLVVVGNGMVGHRLVELLAARDTARQWQVVVVGEETLPAYDRVHLTSYLEGATADELSLVGPGFYDTADGPVLHTGSLAVSVDRAARTVRLADGRVLAYDALVLATGSTPFVPPVPGAELPGVFVYRTLDDLDAIRAAAHAAGQGATGAVVGGGLLGLEAANALRALGMATHVVEYAPRLMPVQVDVGGGASLRRHVEARGLTVRTDARTESLQPGPDGRVARMRFGASPDGTAAQDLAVDLVVFSAGIRPRDSLARDAGLEVGPRGGVVVDDACRTTDPAVFALGECACIGEVVHGLVAPGYAMAEVVAQQLLGVDARFATPAAATTLKLLGVDVASLGDAHGATPGALSLVHDDPLAGVYAKLVVSADGKRLLGGVLVGDATAYPMLAPLLGKRLPADPGRLLRPAAGGGGLSVADLPDDALVCSCNAVTKGAVCSAVRSGEHTLAGLKSCTTAGTGCGSCVSLVDQLRRGELESAGIEVSRALCEHFDHSRADLYALVSVHGYTTFSQLLAAHGTGRGCEICRPTIASILASREGAYILEGEAAALQDTNDWALANLQKDGTYSVVPRMPAGEVTPAGLRLVAEVAEEFGLYTKITGGQRVDLFGARLEQLPLIWGRLVDGGFESGHAYGKALRTVKSCVGSSWCRYGVQDSVAMAVRLELRYRGLRAPHKIKAGVSGCARECAEAQSKDIGVIATEKGWNLYVGGNGGARPAHAQLFAQDLDDDTMVRYIDRVLAYYVMTADRLQRTAPWLAGLEGGLAHLRAVVVADSLGLGAELDAFMARHVSRYVDEWARTLDDPVALSRFVSFVNAPGTPDPDVVFVTERGQPRPATPQEKAVLLTGPRIPVGAP